MNLLLENLMKDAFDFLKSVSDLAKTVAAAAGTPETNGILSYPLEAKGHMFRPFLIFLTALAVSAEKPADKGKLVTFAAAVELIHNASLIHDDLIDGSEIRRGKQSLFRKYGQNNAVLAGNCYYIRALQLSSGSLGSEITVEILNAAMAMCTGELLQAQYGQLTMPDDVYFDVIRAKTAALTALSCKGAAMLTGGNAGQWGLIGEKIGLIYQLKDDAKDRDVRVMPDFSFDHRIGLLMRETEELLEKEGCSDNRRFTELIRLF